MTPLELVQSHYKFPFEEIKPKQIETVNELAPLQTQGHYLDVGAGKTFTSTACALFHRISTGAQIIVIMPPVLIPQWAAWLKKIKPPLTHIQYRGTPAVRKAMNFDVDVILVGIQIFKKDYERFVNYFNNREVFVIVDEATMVALIDSDQHKKVYEFTRGRPVALLTGTPAKNPVYAYGLIKFTSPGTYRSFRHFENLHIEERDFFGNAIKFCNLDLLSKNLEKNSKRVLFEDVYPSTDPPLFQKLDYDLEPSHLKLYTRLAEEELLKLPDGGKIDATTAQKMLHALGQIVVNWGHFAGDNKLVSEAFNIVEDKMQELGKGKLVVFANYRMTVASLVHYFGEKYGAVAINSEVSAKQKEANVISFIEDPDCQMLVLQFRAGGFGLDGLQHVSNHALFIEPCQQAMVFTQCVGRLKRTGQTKRVVIWLATAADTLQVRGFDNLLHNDDLVNAIIRNAYDLRAMIMGQ